MLGSILRGGTDSLLQIIDQQSSKQKRKVIFGAVHDILGFFTEANFDPRKQLDIIRSMTFIDGAEDPHGKIIDTQTLLLFYDAFRAMRKAGWATEQTA